MKCAECGFLNAECGIKGWFSQEFKAHSAFRILQSEIARSI
jgi:hypothetical protein